MSALSNAAKTMAILRQSAKGAIEKPMVWIDCEMTGLDVYNDHIIEICCIITDGNLNMVEDEPYESTVYYPKQVLDEMNEWCRHHHTKSGLTQKVLDNPNRTLEKVNSELLQYIQKWVQKPRTAVMAGNTIHMDKFFMNREFKPVVDHLHYRVVDVSSFFEMGQRHNPELMAKQPLKKSMHTSKSDILESIQQLRWFRENYLIGPETEK